MYTVIGCEYVHLYENRLVGDYLWGKTCLFSYTFKYKPHLQVRTIYKNNDTVNSITLSKGSAIYNQRISNSNLIDLDHFIVIWWKVMEWN